MSIDRAKVVELRVHGVNATDPSTVLCDAVPEQVAGDDAARGFRPQNQRPRNGGADVVEAFDWQTVHLRLSDTGVVAASRPVRDP